MRIDVIIPTYNRCGLLRKTLESFLKAHVPAGLDLGVLVVDNNSTDNTREVVQRYDRKFQGRLKYMVERSQGKSYALNTGITATKGDLIGLIDDDEEVDPHWLETVHEWFCREDVDFIGGPYKPKWEAAPPRWLPQGCPGVLGIVDDVQEVRTFGKDHFGMLMGGNAVVRRSVFEKVGLYSTQLGRTDKRLLSCEDEDMYERILSSGAHGKYIPDLIIYHHIPESRLKKRYFRSWFFWRGVSKFVKDQQRPEPVPHLLRVPRYLFGNTFRKSVRSVVGRPQAGRSRRSEIFSAELLWWGLAGWVYGRCIHRSSNDANAKA